MQNFQSPAEIECQIASMGGSLLSLSASETLKVWELKERIRSAERIPVYEQHLYIDHVKMHSNASLSAFLPVAQNSCVKISLVRSRVPDEISRLRASVVWQGFMAFSKNCGDTIDGRCLTSVLRYAGLQKCAALSLLMATVPTSLTFPQCLAHVVELKQAAALSSVANDVDAESDEESVVVDVETDSDDDGAFQGCGEFSFEDPLMDGDARLILKGKHEAHSDE
eukprot:TRINITY_DN5991_c0_g2_i1.p1 TRINITY_DN5991_c0_g2~~TRINITY_DN5991_c0_g2_i1.p1  ORF type:complete len:257 (+),score=37.33 TRINITY_DN5991_c0_g2_i1:100-771(+)